MNLLILQALNERASDIHVEPTADNLRIRYRIDGVLHDMSAGARAIAAAVMTRLKVMADMNIAEHRVPQDGRISLTVGNRQIDLRMATLPTIYGEKVVMRVLDKSNVVLGFEDLGFDDDMLEIYRGSITKPYGTILVTGPTGSGKTTTLYATLSRAQLPREEHHHRRGPRRAAASRGSTRSSSTSRPASPSPRRCGPILRSDPDIVLVGEIRDRETALISIEAALTGHLVLATLHTNNAAAPRCVWSRWASSPTWSPRRCRRVLAQRLARRLCRTARSRTRPPRPTSWPPAGRRRGLRHRRQAHALPGGRLLRLLQHRLPGT